MTSEPARGYGSFLEDLKVRVRGAQLRAALAANRELVMLYWDIGCGILERQEKDGWGAKVVDRLARDLKTEFPEMRGFSPRNLKYMRTFAAAWPDPAIVQGTLAQIPWYHNIALLERLSGSHARGDHQITGGNMMPRASWLSSALAAKIQKKLDHLGI